MHQKEKLLEDLESAVKRFTARQTKLTSLSRRFSYYRLVIFIAGLALVLISFFTLSEIAVWITLAASVIIFGITAERHNRLNKAIKKNGFWIKIKQVQAARIKIDWPNIPQQEFNIPDENHPFESDLNITGKYSLHRLLDNTVSLEGSILLKNWLTAAEPSEEVISKKQTLVKELIPLTRFRNKLILNSYMVAPGKLESRRFTNWLKSDNEIPRIKKVISFLWVLLAINIVLFLLYFSGILPPVFTVGVLIYAGFYFFNLNLIRDSFDKALHIESELGKFAAILSFLETYQYKDDSLLRSFCSPFLGKETPSEHFRRIKNLINALSFQKNPITALVLNLVFPWDFFFTLKLEKEKEDLAAKLNEWLNTWHNLEALNALAEFAFLNPEYTFPSFTKTGNGNVLQVKSTGHPLIPYTENVKNDFLINELGEIIIITGSNMSGKSTFLKALGANLVLAYAGGPVNAADLSVSLFRIFTCIKITDSVTDGISYFYAEVKRLKKLLDRLNDPEALPLFFLIDEIFRGTNNLERLTGSRSYIKALTGKKGTGLITTHDLELVKLEQEAEQIRNFHFREEAVKNKMVFDYTLRKGPCPTTNALKIMKIEGLPVD